MTNLDSLAEKEKILQFGIELGGIDNLFGSIISTLMESSPWPITIRREYCTKGGLVDKAKEKATNMLMEINNNYSEVPTAEKYKTMINERLAKLEELASHYGI
jgi:hypothetical protein